MLNKLYENIGNKIKNWAMWMFIIEAISAVITGIVILVDWGFRYGWWALFIIILGPIVSFVSTWILYAFGQLVEDVRAIRNKEGTASELERKIEENTKQETTKKTKRVPEKKENRASQKQINREIGEKAEDDDERIYMIQNKYIDVTCPKCKENLSFWENTEEAKCPFCGFHIEL